MADMWVAPARSEHVPEIDKLLHEQRWTHDGGLLMSLSHAGLAYMSHFLPVGTIEQNLTVSHDRRRAYTAGQVEGGAALVRLALQVRPILRDDIPYMLEDIEEVQQPRSEYVQAGRFWLNVYHNDLILSHRDPMPQHHPVKDTVDLVRAVTITPDIAADAQEGRSRITVQAVDVATIKMGQKSYLPVSHSVTSSAPTELIRALHYSEQLDSNVSRNVAVNRS